MAAADYNSVVQQLYVAYFGRPADPVGLTNFTGQLNAIGAPKDITALNAAYSTNSTVKALVDQFGTSAESAALYSGSTAAFVNAIYSNVLNRTADLSGLLFWSAAIDSGSLSRGKAAMAIMQGALTNTSAQGVIDAAVVNNKILVAANFTTALDTTAEVLSYSGNDAAAAARTMLQTVTNTTDTTAFQATVTSTITAIGNIVVPGTTYTLTTAVDNLVGGAGNDIFNGSDTTFTGLDIVDGGTGTDTLNLSDVAGDAINVAVATIKNIETLNVTSSKGLGNTGTQDYSGLTGLTALNLSLKDAGTNNQTITAADTAAVNVSISGISATKTVGITGGKSVTFSEVATATKTAGTVTVTGTSATTTVSATETGTGTRGAINVTDVNSASATKAGTITTITLDGIGAASTITDNALTTLTLNNTAQVVTITDNLSAHTTSTTTLALNTNKLAAGAGLTDTNSTIGTLNITNTGAASALNITSNTSLKTVTVAGDKAVDLSGSTWGALTSLTSTNTGGVTASIGTGVAASFSSGADVLTVGATTKAITMGDGNDTVNLSVAALGTGGSIDAGAGTGDILSVAAADAVTASAGTTFAASVKGFEVLKLAANGAANPTVDLANLNNSGNNSIHIVEFAATNTDSITLANLTSGDTVQFDAAQTAGKTVTASVTGAVTGTTDVLNVKVTNVASIDAKTIDASNVETVNFLTNDTANDTDATVATTHLQHIVSLTDAAAKVITVTGDAGINLTNTSTALTSFDASGVTDGTVTFTTAALANAATIKGGAYANVIDFSAATKAVTYTGGALADTINFANANTKANVVDLGNGTNAFNGGTNANGNNTITGGTGADTIAVGTGANTIHLGGGTTANSVTVGAAAGLNVIDTNSTGVDTMGFTGVQTAAGYYTTLTGWSKGDVINFTGTQDGATGLSAATTLGTQISLGGAASFANYLDAAAASTVAHTATVLHWFQYGGNTYIVHDTSNNSTFSDGHDTVIALTGVVDLSTATVAAAVVTLG